MIILPILNSNNPISDNLRDFKFNEFLIYICLVILAIYMFKKTGENPGICKKFR